MNLMVPKYQAEIIYSDPASGHWDSLFHPLAEQESDEAATAEALAYIERQNANAKKDQRTTEYSLRTVHKRIYPD